MIKLRDLLSERLTIFSLGGGDWGPSLMDVIKEIPATLAQAVTSRIKEVRPGKWKQLKKERGIGSWAAMPKGSKPGWTVNMRFFDREQDAKRYALTGEEVRNGKVVDTFEKDR